MPDFDVIVVGGGPAGVTAALRARELGATVALVERGHLGGTCTNDGCVPTRVLAKAARLVRDAEQFADYGLVGHAPVVNFTRLLERTNHIVYRVHEKKQLRSHLEQSGIRVIDDAGEASFVGEQAIALADGTTLQADKFILCVGGHARRLAFPGSEYALTHSDVWSLTKLPRSVAIVGGAATGCQLASVFEAFGAKVHVLEAAPRILGVEDEMVSQSIAASFLRRGIEITTGIGGVEKIEEGDDGLHLFYTHEGASHELTAEAIIMAVGWPGNVETLNLAAAGVGVERGYIKVDDTLRTANPRIFAAGDITGRMMLVQSASGEGAIAAENAVLGGDCIFAHAIVPHGGFTDPEYGSVGLTESRAREAHDCAVSVVHYAELDRAVIDGHTEGFCKLIVDAPSRRILGAHVVGEQALEVVQIVAAGMAAGTLVDQIADLELAYPTFTAIVGLAARRIVHDLGIAQPRAQWRTLGITRAAEWEWQEA